MIYSLTGTIPPEHTLLSSLHQRHQFSHARAHIYNMAVPAPSEACLHSALLYPCALRAVNWHISCNGQIQQSEGTQKSGFSYRALCSCDLSTAQVILALSWGSSSQIRVSPINLKSTTSWLLTITSSFYSLMSRQIGASSQLAFCLAPSGANSCVHRFKLSPLLSQTFFSPFLPQVRLWHLKPVTMHKRITSRDLCYP